MINARLQVVSRYLFARYQNRFLKLLPGKAERTFIDIKFLQHRKHLYFSKLILYLRLTDLQMLNSAEKMKNEKRGQK